MEQHIVQYLESSKVLVLTLDLNANVTYINSGGCEILGCEKKDVIGKNWIDEFIPDDIQDDLRKVFKSIYTAETEFEDMRSHVNTVKTKNGTIVVSWTNGILHDGGTVIGTVSFGADITKQEAERKKIEKRFEEIVNSYPDTILILNKNFEILDVYPSSVKENFAGVCEMIGRPLTEHIRAAGNDQSADDIDLILKSIMVDRKAVTNKKVEMESPHGTGKRVFDITLKAFNNDKIMAIMADITEKEKLDILIEFQEAINKLSENNRKTMSTLFKTNVQGEK